MHGMLHPVLSWCFRYFGKFKAYHYGLMSVFIEAFCTHRGATGQAVGLNPILKKITARNFTFFSVLKEKN